MPVELSSDVPVGIVAGSGDLPQLVVAECEKARRPFMLIAVEGETAPETVKNRPHCWIRLDGLGKGFKKLAADGYRHLVMAGRVGRPELSAFRPDFATIRLIYRLSKTRMSGDDAVLATVIAYLEERGFMVHGVQAVAPALLAPQGVMGSIQPDARAQSDVALGVEVSRHIGLYDIGQAVVVQTGRVLGVEAAEGTDKLLERIPTLAAGHAPGGVLVKTCKPKQDVRVDLPALGPDTVRHAAKAGLRGIAMEAGKSLMIHRDVMVAEADRLGLFLYGVRCPESM